MEKKENIYEFHNVTEWLSYTSRLGSAYSPGGFAMRAGVSRSTVNSWIYRDKIIDYYKCRAEGGGEYGVIPATEFKKVSDRIKKRKKV